MKSSIRLLAFTALAGAGLVAGLPSAKAADLGMPYVAPAAVPVAAVGGGWYLRGDVGVSVKRGGRWHETEIENAAPTDQINDWAITKSSNSGNIALGVGYQFNDWFRADLTGQYRLASKLHGYQVLMDGDGNFFTGNDKANLSSWVFLANAYADLGHYNGLTPYVGAGIGVVLNQFHDGTQVSGADATGSWGTYADGNKWGLAGALHAGLGYEINRNWKLDVGYSWLWLGNTSSGAKTCYAPAGPCGVDGTRTNERWWINGSQSHDIHIGLRYVFGADAPVYYPVTARN